MCNDIMNEIINAVQSYCSVIFLPLILVSIEQFIRAFYKQLLYGD